ncbi:MAG TPA: ATP-binding protein [Candidatus Thermoplasmatota archaeon]|nr:ATP-binding protein [Candidatus Thermoplasmatota archaeon]
MTRTATLVASAVAAVVLFLLLVVGYTTSRIVAGTLPPAVIAVDLAVSLLALGGFVVLLGAYLPAHTVRPLLAVRDRLLQAGRGHLDERVHVRGTAEIEAVAEAANAALKALSERERLVVHAERLAMVDLLLSGVAHEVNTPLTSLLLDHAALRRELAGDLADPARRERIQRLSGRVDKNLARLQHVVTILRQMAPSLHGPRSEHDVNVLLEGALLLLDSPEYRDVEIVKEFQPDVRVEGSVRQLSHVFLAVLHNAAQAVGGRGRVAVRTALSDGHAVVHVEDDGPGMPEHVRQRLFQPFVTTKAGATGLGLHLAHRAIVGMGGQIAVRDTGRGTLVEIRIPVVSPNTTDRAASTAEEAAGRPAEPAAGDRR